MPSTSEQDRGEEAEPLRTVAEDGRAEHIRTEQRN